MLLACGVNLELRPTQCSNVISAQPTAAEPQRSDPGHMLEVGRQRFQTTANQLVPGDVHLLQLREKLEQRR